MEHCSKLKNSKKNSLVLWGNGKAKREVVHVDDIAQLVYLVACYKTTGIANAVSGQVVSFRQLAEFILEQNIH